MGNTKEYLDYLNNEVGIAPAASQEELDFAQSLADTYAKHGLNPEVQEFPAQSWGLLPHGVALVLVFVGIILLGIGTLPTTLIGLVLTAGMIVLLGLYYTGQDALSKVGPVAHSQNVVAVRKADEGNERNRPVVILAHYDTPRVDPLTNPQLAKFKKYLPLIVPNALCAVAVCGFIQILGFLPEAARRTFWVLGIIAAVPALAWGIALIARKFGAYTDGAVGNKSSVAALLTVMDHVCAGDSAVERTQTPEVEGEPAVEDEIDNRPLTRTVVHEEVEQIEGKRHGEAMLRQLGILPETCEITYVAPKVHTYETEEPIEYSDDEVTSDEAASDMKGATVMMDALSSDEADPNSTRPMEAIPEQRIDAADSVLVSEDLSQLEDGEATDEGPLQETDHSGLSTMVDEDAEAAASAPREARVAPASVDDPSWGKSSYTPSARSKVTNVARRAALFDLPNVSSNSDGLSADESETSGASYGMSFSAPANAAQTAGPSPMAQCLAEASQRVAAAPAPVRLDDEGDATQFVASGYASAPIQDNIEVLDGSVNLNDTSVPERRGLAALFGRKRKQQKAASDWAATQDAEEDTSSDESARQKRGHWKGGAARSINLRNSGLSGLPEIAEDPADIPLSALKNAPAAVAEQDPNATIMAAPIIAPVPEASAPANLLDEDNQEQGAVPSEMPLAEDSQENTWTDDSSDEGLFVDADQVRGDETAEAIEAEEGVEPEAEPFAPSPVDRELRDAILAMGDDELKKHDVWFVLTGASELNHAGVNEFIAAHRKDLRGAFIINLETVGAGELTALSHEGFGRSRRADRRLLRLLSSIASDMHFELPQLKRTWADTEATPCMRRSMRAVTLMGMDENELPIYASTVSDSPELVDEDKIVDAVALVTEVIKRS